MYSPTDIANLALDAIGSEFVLGDIEDGTDAAQVCLRNYPECRTTLLRGAHWQFARKQQPLFLLADATGNTPGVPTNAIVPWVYEYAYPDDAVAVRFIPYQPSNPGAPPGNISIPPNVPLTSGLQNTTVYASRLRPARFLVARDVNFPPAPGQQYWDVQGASPQGRTVVLTNVQCAFAVYTSDVQYPSEWDVLFRDAMVSYLAQRIVMRLEKDRKTGIEIRREQIAITKEKLTEARRVDGNETWSSTDHVPDWIRFRNSGGPWGYGWGENCLVGSDYMGWSSVGFSDGSAY